MADAPKWQYDELRHAGVDYADAAVARAYDEKHGRFRDYEAQTQGILAALGVGSEATIIDMGCGTGAFALAAARRCRKVYAVDVSPAMLDCLREKAAAAGVANVECHQGGFLSYEHADPPVDAIVSVAALHHLPDFWKLVALRRLARMLRPHGRVYLFDVVFPSAVDDYRPAFDRWIASARDALGADFAEEAETHIRDEYSTCDWIMEGILERAGFVIDDKQEPDTFLAAYVCSRRPGE
ncbi:MAG: class I SAM-dependent methyltransferase [Candidatus Hydrogenedentes bacterium]|nr:class I SAM-dependent methyltransferase [Candidatus Hydrogenedentota bacterium]